MTISKPLNALRKKCKNEKNPSTKGCHVLPHVTHYSQTCAPQLYIICAALLSYLIIFLLYTMAER